MMVLFFMVSCFLGRKSLCQENENRTVFSIFRHCGPGLSQYCGPGLFQCYGSGLFQCCGPGLFQYCGPGIRLLYINGPGRQILHRGPPLPVVSRLVWRRGRPFPASCGIAALRCRLFPASCGTAALCSRRFFARLLVRSPNARIKPVCPADGLPVRCSGLRHPLQR